MPYASWPRSQHRCSAPCVQRDVSGTKTVHHNYGLSSRSLPAMSEVLLRMPRWATGRPINGDDPGCQANAPHMWAAIYPWKHTPDTTDQSRHTAKADPGSLLTAALLHTHARRAQA
jgi:hypothetical protein